MKVIDGLNISLAEAIGLGFKRLDDQQFELKDGTKTFVLSGLVGVVREIAVEEDIEAGNSANGEQELKHSRKAHHETGHLENSNDTDDNIQLAGEPLNNKNVNEELSDDRKALEQNGFHVIGEDGFQSGSKKNNNVNKESITGPSTIKGNLNTGHLELEKEEEQRFKKNKKS